MKKGFLKVMHCPYCGKHLEIKEAYEEENEEIITGYLKCECGEYPILDGILILQNSPVKRYILDYLKEGKTEKAAVLPFWDYNNDICRVVDSVRPKLGGKFLEKSSLSFVNHFSKRIYKRYSDKSISFYDILGNSSYETYLKHRFSAETLWSVYPFIPLLKKERKRILDLGCGMGHASFIISSYVKPEELVCADHAFKSLYLTKKYFAKDAQFICLDADYPLPFKNNTFNSVFTLDALHYIQTRAQLANELKRVLYPQGLLLLLHLHNALIHNIGGADYPLTPEAWINLFRDDEFKVKAMPEKGVVENFFLNNKLDLIEENSETELNSSNAISILGTRDQSRFRVYDNVNSDFLSATNDLVINPIYKMKEEGDKMLLERNYPSESFKKEYPITEQYLPVRSEINKRFVNGRRVYVSGSDEIEIEELMKKFVVINVPNRYLDYK